MKKRSQVLIITGAVIVIFLMYLFSLYNGLVKAEENVSSKWSQVENQLQRRADLIPNLVNTVKGYAKHEKEILEKLAEARSKLINSKTVEDKAKADEELSGLLSRLLVIVENYPDLKADRTFTMLMDELSGTENRIAVARKDYNDAVMSYNTRIKVFPTVVIARLFGFEPKPYFRAQESANQVPKVDFSQ
ncbi:LemA family protein [Caldicellulosiruptor morganii]|uniref:LemA family protein n=1 Tax=Caldicellulosiruptor morganii TaxID=1387555 RepID=A0ABY7BQ35_9FIRM|nr:LemA family protein [Caldicellulosiruptor morganii]WAM33885.1 LemA family protein [Caldicellulosiruptor morganii]